MADDITPAELAATVEELTRLEAKATPGEWRNHGINSWVYVGADGAKIRCPSTHDAAFTAAMRNRLPLLLAALRQRSAPPRDTTTATYFYLELYYRRGCAAVGYSIKDGSMAHLVDHDRKELADQMRRLAQCLEDQEYPFASKEVSHD